MKAAVITRKIEEELNKPLTTDDAKNVLILLKRLDDIKVAAESEIGRNDLKSEIMIRADRSSDIKVLDWIDAFLDRITNKSVGLLQALSVPTAILTIYQSQSPSKLTGIFVALTFFVALLLLLNLRVVVWSPLDAYSDAKMEIQHCLRLIRWRSARLTIAIYLGAFGLVCGSLAMIFPATADAIFKLLP